MGGAKTPYRGMSAQNFLMGSPEAPPPPTITILDPTRCQETASSHHEVSRLFRCCVPCSSGRPQDLKTPWAGADSKGVRGATAVLAALEGGRTAEHGAFADLLS